MHKCPESGSYDSYLKLEQTKAPDQYQTDKTTWDDLKAAGANDSYIAAYAESASDCGQFNSGSADYGALAYDPAGFLYLADTGNQRIRRIDLSSGIIDTFIGPNRNFGAGLVGSLKALYVGLEGDLYFGAQGEILRVTRSGQLVERFGVRTGACVPAFDGTPLTSVCIGNVHGLALDGQGNIVYSDSNTSRIIRLNRATGVQETVGGVGPATFGEDGPALAAASVEHGAGPWPDLAVLPGGEIIFSGSRIRKIGLDGRLSSVAGNGLIAGKAADGIPATSTSWPSLGLELDAQGNLYYATYYNVVKVDSQGILRIVAGQNDFQCGFSGDGGPARSARLCQPWDVFLDRDGNVFITDTNNNRIRRVDAKTQIITTVAGSGPVNGFENFGHGSYCGDGGPATEACIDTPEGVAVNADGEIFITERNKR